MKKPDCNFHPGLEHEETRSRPAYYAGSAEPLSREYPLRPLIGVGAVIINGSYVVLVRRGSPPAQGEWSIPGGLVRTGETLKQAVAREVLEETELRVEPGDLVALLERILPDDSGRIQYHYVLADYLCRVSGGRLKAGSDALEAEWVDRNRLHEYHLAELTLRVLSKAFAMV